MTRTWQYEGADMPGRSLGVTEQVSGRATRITEHFVYAGNSDAEKAWNLAGQRISHYDTAGLVQTNSVALTGTPLTFTRRLLKGADSPDTLADWQGEDISIWNDLLSDGAHITLTTADATGTVLTSTDAKGNLQRVAYDVAGQVNGRWLTVKDSAEQVIVKSLTWSAAGQKLREAHGNGVVTTHTYESQTQRLTRMKTERPAGHVSGARVLQDLLYEYDPAGNVLKISNDAEETRFWRNQKVVPENTYVYDSLYQLVSATGREMAQAGPQGSSLPPATVFLPTDSSAYTNYTRAYTYDEAGNLTQIRHRSPATNNNYTTIITVSNRSNRGVLSTLTENPAEVEALFTAGGQQTQLLKGQSLVWTPRNELLRVASVVRDGGASNRESYRYDAGSQRLLKVSVQKKNGSTQTQRVLYLPGLELRTTHARETEQENLQVITVGDAGRVRVLHWERGRPDDISNDQLRWSYDSLNRSCSLELDRNGRIISTEEYYPYGGTAILTARNTAEVSYRAVRYSGKEQDVTGLYYYGYRYYQPWAGRWLSADPAGFVDGLNLFRMVRNNPVTLSDVDGLNSRIPNKIHHFWQGDISGLKKHYSNIRDVALKNPGYKVQLHLLPENEEDINEVRKNLPDIKVKNINQEKWFKKFQKSDRYKTQFLDSKNGSRRHMASGADIIKSELLAYKGGIWNDVDNRVITSLPEKLKVAKGDFLTDGVVTFSRWGGSTGIHSSTLATHKGNKNLIKINNESYKKYLKLKGIIYQKNAHTDNPDTHFKMISETAGSLHMTEEFFKLIPGFKDEVMELSLQGLKYNDKRVIMDKYFEPVSTTGAGNIDEQQVINFIQAISPPGHVMI